MSTTLGKSTEQIRDDMDSLNSLARNQKPVQGTKVVVDPHSLQIVDPHSLQIVDPHNTPSAKDVERAHNEGLQDEIRHRREQEELRSEREQRASESLEAQRRADQEELHSIQAGLKEDLRKVEKEQAKLDGKQSLVDQMKEGLAAGLASTKERIVGRPTEPVVGEPEGSQGMPGRYHPEPAPFEAGLMTRIGDSVQGGIASAQAGLKSAKDQVIGQTVEPIESGMPGRYHPHPEPLEATPGLMDKVSAGLTSAQSAAQSRLASAQSAAQSRLASAQSTAQSGLASAQSAVQSGLASAQEGLASVKDRFVPQKVTGMPGRYHPQATELEHFPSGAAQTAPTGESEVVKDSIDLDDAKERLEQETVAGMPGLGRNHPNPETLETPSGPGVASRIGDAVRSGLASAKENLALAPAVVASGFSSARDTLKSAKDQYIGAVSTTAQPPLETRSEIEKDSIDVAAAKDTLEQLLPQPMEDMPGAARYHPHPESLENLGLMDKMKIGLTSAKDTAQASLVAAKDSILTSAKGTAQAGYVAAKDTVAGGLSYAKDTLMPRTEIKEDAIDVEGMPGRNHPHPESLENLGLMDKMKIGLTSAKDTAQSGLSSARETVVSAKDTVQPYLVSAKESAQTGLSSARDSVQPYLASAKDTIQPYLTSAKDTAQTSLASAKEGLSPTQIGTQTSVRDVVLVQDSALLNAQASLISAQASLISAQGGLLAGRDTSAKQDQTSTPDVKSGLTLTPVAVVIPTSIDQPAAKDSLEETLPEDQGLLAKLKNVFIGDKQEST